MKLNDEMCEMALSSKSICSVYDENYVVLKKNMPVTDDKLDWYINSIRKLRDSGVNIASIVDYKLLPETTRSYQRVGSYTEGIFLEERAKGKSLDSDSIYLRAKKDYDFSSVVIAYLEMVSAYIAELELRANASQEVYAKFISDCLSVQKQDLVIDPKPLNFFFDSQEGYTIIDVTPGNEHADSNFMKYFPEYIFTAVFGYGKPNMSIEFNDCSVLPQEMIDRLNIAGKTLEAKIVSSLRKFGFSEEDIALAISKNRFRYENTLPSVEIEDMETYLTDIFTEEKNKQKNAPSSDDGLFVIKI